MCSALLLHKVSCGFKKYMHKANQPFLLKIFKGHCAEEGDVNWLIAERSFRSRGMLPDVFTERYRKMFSFSPENQRYSSLQNKDMRKNTSLIMYIWLHHNTLNLYMKTCPF
jgi:hypothetical protein